VFILNYPVPEDLTVELTGPSGPVDDRIPLGEPAILMVGREDFISKRITQR
jgi:hypothetical protein